MPGTKGKKDSRRSQLSVKLLIATWAISSLATLVFTAAQLYADYFRDYNKLTSNFEIVERSYLQSLAEHLWSYDNRLLEIQLDGLKRIDGISFLRLKDTSREIYVTGHSQRTEQNSRTFKIYHGESKELLGTLEVEVDIDSLKMKYLEDVFWIFIRQATKTAIVVFILYFIFNQLVVGHLAKITTYLSTPDVEKEGPLVLNRKPGEGRDELDMLVENINEYRELNQEKISSLANLTTGIAHEIRNPLDSVVRSSEVLKESINELARARSPEQVLQTVSELKTISATISKNSGRIDQIVKTMQLLASNPNATFGIVDLEQLVQESLKNIRAKYDESTVASKVRIELDLQDIKIRAQKKQLLIAIDNLLDNAFYSLKRKLDAYPQDFHPSLRIQTEVLKDKIRMSIWDNGLGIEMSAIDKIFDPFFTTKPLGEGAGLGLTISFEVVKRQGGQLRLADTNKNEFALFVIELPLESRIIA